MPSRIVRKDHDNSLDAALITAMEAVLMKLDGIQNEAVRLALRADLARDRALATRITKSYRNSLK